MDDNALSVNISRIREKTAFDRAAGSYQNKTPAGVFDMKRSAYIRQLLPALGANLAGMAAISLFLLAVGNSIGTVG